MILKVNKITHWSHNEIKFLSSKVAFFSESAIRFSNLQMYKKKYLKKTILSLKFEFQVQDSFLEYFFLEIWISEKRITLSEKATFKKWKAKMT